MHPAQYNADLREEDVKWNDNNIYTMFSTEGSVAMIFSICLTRT